MLENVGNFHHLPTFSIMTTQAERAIKLLEQTSLIRAGALNRQGVTAATLTRLVRSGVLLRVARGVYALPGSDISEHVTLAEASQRVPKGIVCLLSALRFHELTTQLPHEVWLAIPVKARAPSADSPPLRVVRFSGAALTEGIEEHEVDGVTVRITSPSRTVVDCFRFRNKIGLDIAVESLRDLRRTRDGSLEELWRLAGVLRASNVIRPYVEATS